MVCRLCPNKTNILKVIGKILKPSIIASLLTGQFHRGNTYVPIVPPLKMPREDVGVEQVGFGDWGLAKHWLSG